MASRGRKPVNANPELTQHALIGGELSPISERSFSVATSDDGTPRKRWGSYDTTPRKSSEASYETTARKDSESSYRTPSREGSYESSRCGTPLTGSGEESLCYTTPKKSSTASSKSPISVRNPWVIDSDGYSPSVGSNLSASPNTNKTRDATALVDTDELWRPGRVHPKVKAHFAAKTAPCANERLSRSVPPKKSERPEDFDSSFDGAMNKLKRALDDIDIGTRRFLSSEPTFSIGARPEPPTLYKRAGSKARAQVRKEMKMIKRNPTQHRLAAAATARYKRRIDRRLA